MSKKLIKDLAKDSMKTSLKPTPEASFGGATSNDAFTVDTTDGVRLFVNCWKGSANNGRALLIVHGLGEHGGRYAHLPHHLGDTFETIYALDLRGHGRSTGLRGYSPSFDQFVDDVLLVANRLAPKESKLVLLGHSMGGLIALRLLQRKKKVPFETAIISAPFLGLALEVPGWKKSLGKILSKSLSKVQLNNEINPSYLSHDPEAVTAYVNDRLVHSKCTPRLYVDLMDAVANVSTETVALACPSLFLVPGQDRIVKAEATLEYFAKLKDRHKTLKQYPGFYHEPMNEVGRAQVFADIKSWLQQSQG